MSCTPSCDGWLIWLWGTLSSWVKLMCVAMCVFHACVSNKPCWHLAEQPELWLHVRGRESPVHLHAFHSLVSLFSPEATYGFSDFTPSAVPYSGSTFFFCPQKCISQQKPEVAEGRNAALLSSQKRPLSVPAGRPAKSYLCLFLHFWGINVF